MSKRQGLVVGTQKEGIRAPDSTDLPPDRVKAHRNMDPPRTWEDREEVEIDRRAASFGRLDTYGDPLVEVDRSKDLVRTVVVPTLLRAFDCIPHFSTDLLDRDQETNLDMVVDTRPVSWDGIDPVAFEKDSDPVTGRRGFAGMAYY